MQLERAPFGSLLKQYRLAAGLSQEALAERAALSAVGVGALERGDRRAPYRHTVERLAMALNLSRDERAQLERAAARPRRRPAVGTLTEDEADAKALHNLPNVPTSFLGREQELTWLRAALPRCRLVTVVGPAGVGKTRLAIEAARSLAREFADGAWCIGLASLSSPDLLYRTVGRALRVCPPGEEPGEHELFDVFAHRNALIVLDNCEHVVEAAARLVDTFLQRCPRVCVLATSREGLKVPGEQIYRLPSLASPPRGGARMTAAGVTRFGAVSLFVERARAANSHFELSDADAHHAADLTRRLDGLPLAIELAAARAGVIPLPELVRRLDERFGLLAGGSRTALPRQQTLRAAIDWSYELLCDSERVLLARLGVFAGGWTLEAAEAVCSAGTLERANVVGVLTSLVEKSLVAAQLDGESGRYWLLESMRAYALEKLAAGDEQPDLARRHAQWVAALVEDVPERSWVQRQPAYMSRISPEIENVRAALRWVFGEANDDRILGGKIAGDLASFWFRYAPAEGRQWCETALARLTSERDPKTTAQLHLALAVLTYAKRSADHAQSAVALFEELGDDSRLARALTVLADAQQECGSNLAAGASLGRALDLFTAMGLAETWRVAGARASRGRMLAIAGNIGDARACFAEALRVCTLLGDEVMAARTAIEQADGEFAAGSAERALELARDVARKSGLAETDISVAALINAAAYALALGDLTAAREAAADGLQRARRLHVRNHVVFAMQHLAAVLAQQGEPQRAALLRGYVDAWFLREGFEREPTEKKSYEILMTALRARLPDDELADLSAAGARLDEDRAVHEALAV